MRPSQQAIQRHFRTNMENCYFHVVMIDDSEHKEVEFLSPTNVNA